MNNNDESTQMNAQSSSQGGNSSSRSRNPADNLTQQDRVRGGQRSAESQRRGPSGKFAGSVRGQRDNGGSGSGQNNSGAAGR